jgi:uncharacterized protein (TIRG00374 family)
LGILAIAAVAFFFFRERHLFLGFGHTLSRLVWLWLVLAFVAEMASTVPLAEAQRIVLAAGGVKIPRPQMILITLASNAISMSVPAGVAVAEGFAYRQYRRFRGTRAATAWGELASGAIAFAALAGIALAGAAVGSASVAVLLLPTLSVVFAGATGAAAVFRHPHVLVAWLEWIEGHVGRRLGGGVARVGARVREMAEGLRGVHPSVSTWAAAFVLSAANWFLDVVSLACSFLAVGGRVPWGAVLLAFAGTKVVSSIAITPGGIGIVEGGLVATFVAYGTPGAVAAAAVLVYRALTLLGLVGVGWVGAGVLAAEKRR